MYAGTSETGRISTEKKCSTAKLQLSLAFFSKEIFVSLSMKP